MSTTCFASFGFAGPNQSSSNTTESAYSELLSVASTLTSAASGGYFDTGYTVTAMAVALPDGGLVTPKMVSADSKDLYLLSREWKDMVGRTMEGKLKPSEMGGTFTISNLGMFGVSTFVSILPPGTGAIMEIGRASCRERV